MKNQNKAYIFAITAVLLWSTVATAFKIALSFVSPLHLLLYASGTAVVIFVIVLLWQGNFKQAFALNPKEFLLLGITGFLNPFLYYVVLLKAYSLLPAQVAQPLNYLWPVVLVLLSVPLLGEKLKIVSLVSLLFGMIGVYIISTKGQLLNFRIDNPFGVFLAAGSSIIWALSWILNQKSKLPAEIKLFWTFVFGFSFTLVSSLFFTTLTILPVKGYLAVIYVGAFEMGITFFFWMKALQFTKRNDQISNIIFLSPFIALIFIHFILKEDIFYTTFIGLLFIIGGILLEKIPKKRK